MIIIAFQTTALWRVIGAPTRQTWGHVSARPSGETGCVASLLSASLVTFKSSYENNLINRTTKACKKNSHLVLLFSSL